MFRPPCPTSSLKGSSTKALKTYFSKSVALPKPSTRSFLAGRALSTSSAGRVSGAKVNNDSSSRTTNLVLGGMAIAVASTSLGLYATGYLEGKSHSIALSIPASSSTAFSTDYASPEELRLAIQELRNTFPEKHVVTTDPETLQLYGSSENSYHPSSPHSVVVRVFGTEDVVKVVNISRKYRVPITAYSGATSLEGHFAGVRQIHPQLLHSVLMHPTVPIREHLYRHGWHG